MAQFQATIQIAADDVFDKDVFDHDVFDGEDIGLDLISTKPMRIKYGIGGTGPLDLVANSGTMEFYLRNDAGNSVGLQGAYSPRHNNCISNWRRGTNIQIKLAYDDVEVTKFTGKVDVIDPTSGIYGEQVVRVLVTDLMHQLVQTNVRQLPLQVNQTDTDLLDTIIAAALPDAPLLDLDDPLDEYPYALDNIDKKTSAVSLIQDVATSGLLFFACRGDGTLFSRNRRTRSLAESLGEFDGNMQQFSAPSRNQYVYDGVLATDNPRTVDPEAGAVLYASTGQPILIQPGETYDFTAPFRDEDELSSLIAGVDTILPLVPYVDYAANELADGSGIDYTESVSVVGTEAFATSVHFVVRNTGSEPLYLVTEGSLLTRTSLTSGTGASSTTHATASVSPSPNQLVVLAIHAIAASAANAAPPVSVSGAGLVFALWTSSVDITSGMSVSLWRAMSEDPSTGAISIVFANAQKIVWSMFELDGVDTSGVNGSGAINANVAEKQSLTGAVDQISATIESFENDNNGAVSAVGWSNAGSVPTCTPGTGWTEIHDLGSSGGGNAWALQTQWRNTRDTSANGQWTANGKQLRVAAEVVAAETAEAGTPLLQIRGKRVRALGPREFKAGLVNRKTLEVDLKYQTDRTTSASIAQYLFSKYGEDNEVATFGFVANTSDYAMRQALQREPGDIVTVSEQMTAIKEEHEVIQNITLELLEGLIFCKWGLAPAGVFKQWFIGIVGSSEIGQTTSFGF